MICAQGKDIENQGGSPGAAVVVQMDYHAVSYAIGIADAIYQITNTGGAQISTVTGLLSTGSMKGNWQIHLISMSSSIAPNKISNIYAKLEIIQQPILLGEYNNNNAARCTIQEVHQVITEAISQCRKSKYGCANGVCKVEHCGCIKKGLH
jgi:hypothetical protein